MSKKFLAKFMAATMLVSTLGTSGVYMAAPAADAVPVQNADISQYRAMLNYREESEFDFSMADEVPEHTRDWGTLPGTLPKSYSSSAYVDWDFEVKKNYVTPVKNQEPFGTCWAHSTISAVETSYIMNQEITDVESVDFNEYHLIHYTYDTPADTLGLYGGDYNLILADESFLKVGGSNKVTASVLANWIGVSDSKDFTAEDVEKKHPDAFGYDAVGHLEDAYFIAMPKMATANYAADMYAVKNAIMTYGSIAVSYCSHPQGGIEYSGYYYCPEEAVTNHAVVIVGWDDTIPASKFEEFTGNLPAGDGAWLVKNSWGTENSQMGGYFWLSYYDASIASEAYAYNVAGADNYDNNYQYDGTASVAYIIGKNAYSFANAFVADSAETLEAVGFYTYDTYMDYEIRVYKNLEANEAPQNGDLVLTQSGSEMYAGFHTIELEDAVNINKNERYAVVVTLKKEGKDVYVVSDKTTNWGWLGFHSYAKEGQSYIGSSVDALFDINQGNADYADGMNVRLKAYTNEITETKFTLSPESAELGSGEQLQLNVEIFSSDETKNDIVYTSSDTTLATVDENGIVSANHLGKTGVVTITATTLSSQKTASCTITIMPLLATGIELQLKNVSVYIGDTFALSAKIVPANVTNPSITWSSSNPSVATVDKNGTIEGISQGTAIITATTGDGSGRYASCKVTVEKPYPDGLNLSTDGNLYYFKDNTIDTDYKGIASYQGDIWYVTNGMADKTVNGLVDCENEKYYFKNGKVERVTILTNDANGWWYVKDGQVDFGYNGVFDNENGTWYIANGQVDFSKNGVLNCGDDWYLFKAGQVQRVTTVANNENGWWYIRNGQVDFTANTLAKNENGWWYIKNGQVDFSYNGLAEDYAGDAWYIQNGAVNFDVNGLEQCGDEWCLFKGGQVQKITTVTNNANGWWYVEDGRVNFDATTVANNANGWWYIKNGQVDFGYHGVADNENGTWYIANGQVDFGQNGVLERSGAWYYFKGGQVQYVTTIANNANGWWYIKNGQVDFGYHGVADNENGTWYIANGQVDFGQNGVLERSGVWYYFKGGQVQYVTTVANNANGWWYIKNGKVDFSYNGLASNENGTWYIVNGQVNFSYTGEYTEGNDTYQIENGKVVESTNTILPQKVYQDIIALKKTYPEGMRWTNADYYSWNGGIYPGGYGCAGFAFLLSDAAFGDLPAVIHHDISEIRVGDILRINGDTHSVVVLEVTDTGIVIAEGNYNSSIHWGRQISWKSLEDSLNYIMTRYPS